MKGAFPAFDFEVKVVPDKDGIDTCVVEVINHITMYKKLLS